MKGLTRGTLTIAAAAIIGAASSSAQSQSVSVGDVLQRVGERLAEYYKRAQSVMCLEKYSVQPIGHDWSAMGVARVTESELRVEPDADDGDGPTGPKVVRLLRKVNGRTPRDRDKKDRSGCTDLNPLSSEPLEFLLPAHRDEYTFVSAALGKGKDSNTILIEYNTTGPRKKVELIEDTRGHEDCFDFTSPLPKRGKVWVHATTFDVIRIEERTLGPVDVRVPWALQRKHNIDDPVVVEREDMTIRYKKVAFRDPDEAMLLPESIVQLVVVRGGLQSTRRSQTFTDYQRFMTDARLVR